jgi:putative tryptophan/tyrosine transport system substrate-binding protein
MKRREFLTLISAVAAWPVVARAQRPERMRRVSVLMNTAADDVEGQERISAFVQRLQGLGWTEGQNVHVDTRWASGMAGGYRKSATELVELKPEVILANGTPAVAPLLEATGTIPIVFVNVIDPIGAGFVASLAQPGGNATGFTIYEYSMGGKWLEVLKEIAPHLTRAAVLRDPGVASGLGLFGAAQAVAPSLRMELTPVDVRDPGEIERGVTGFARSSNGGLIVTGSAAALRHRDVIISLAARYRLPTIFPSRVYVTGGGLISYGPDQIAPYRRAAEYVDRILKGERPSDLPVQAPTKFQLVVNLKTANSLGITIPQSLLARADEVIE